MTITDVPADGPHQVFISYAQADKSVARQIADALRGAGLKVWFDEWALMPGDSIRQRIDEALRASDLLLVLLSPSSVNSRWVQTEWNAALSSELKARGVTVIPALIADCEIPPLLASRMYLDLRIDLEGGIRRLIQQLGVVPEIDFSKLDGQAFEKLVADLLSELGFSVEHQPVSRDSGFDFVASFVGTDPFGTQRRESWLVEVKLYRNERVSLQALRQMVGYMVTVAGSHKGLVVTNSQLTSVATKFLEDITAKSGRELRVIDGSELRALLLRHPQLVDRYFDKGEEG
jgi:hypothetical protein